MKIVNLEHYRNFVKIVDAGNISSAARELLIAQPSLSRQIQAIEDEYGTILLKRGSRNVELTDAGQIFYERAKLICSMEDITQKEIQACIMGNKGVLRIGFTPSYPDLYVEEVFKEFALFYPKVIYEIHEASSDEILNLLKNEIIEIGIVRTQVHISPIFKSYKAIEEQLMAVFHKSNPWLSADVESIPLQKLQGVPLSISRGFKEKVREVFSDAGFVPTLFSICTSRPTTLMWARLAQAVGLVTTTSFKNLETDILCCRPLTGSDMTTKRTFAVLKEHNLSAVAKSFLSFATEEVDF